VYVTVVQKRIQKLQEYEQQKQEDARQKLKQLEQKSDEMRVKEEARCRQEMEMNILRETEDEFRQLQLKEQQQLDLDQQRKLSDNASSMTISEEQAVLPVMPSAPPDPEPPVVSLPSSSTPPNVLPPSYTSVVHVNQMPSVPSRDLKPMFNSTTTTTTTYVL